MTATPQTAVPDAFRAVYGYEPQVIGRAPGRVNLIGEHTDYNDGFVLPAALDKATYIAAALRDDDIVKVHSLDYGVDAQFTIDNLRAPNAHEVTLYPRGVLWILEDQGHAVRGMDLVIASDVPNGAGLSSSAAAAIAMLEVSSALLNVPLKPTEKALLAVQIEHRFVGVRTGAMDQLISVLGKAGHALLIDCRSLEATPVPIPPGVTMLVLDTGKRRDLTNTEYGKRRSECEQAAQLMGARSLREVTLQRLEEAEAFLPEINYKRAKHVICENARTLETVQALIANNLATVGHLLNAGHASLRDLFQISIPELDIMAELAQNSPGCYGARMMGGGFGGAVIALVSDEAVEVVSAHVGNEYQAATGLPATIYAAHAGPGSGLVDPT
ncbi:MAG: galactokinase [Aggregatilineales bacterium]